MLKCSYYCPNIELPGMFHYVALNFLTLRLGFLHRWKSDEHTFLLGATLFISNIISQDQASFLKWSEKLIFSCWALKVELAEESFVL